MLGDDPALEILCRPIVVEFVYFPFAAVQIGIGIPERAAKFREIAPVESEHPLDRSLVVRGRPGYFDFYLLYLIAPVSLGNQYHNRSAAGLPCTEADLSCSMAGG